MNGLRNLPISRRLWLILLSSFLMLLALIVIYRQTGTTDSKEGGLGDGGNNVHDGVREDIETADCKGLAATLNRDLVRPWIDLEYGPQLKYPRIRIARPKREDVKGLVDNVEKLVGMGMRVGESEMRDKLGLSDPVLPHVGLHEFAHVLDFIGQGSHGVGAHGVPGILSTAYGERWAQQLNIERERADRLAAGIGLDLEARGWKGRAGSALASRPRSTASLKEDRMIWWRFVMVFAASGPPRRLPPMSRRR